MNTLTAVYIYHPIQKSKQAMTAKVAGKTRAYKWQTINAAVSFRCNIRPWPCVSPHYIKMVDVSEVMN